MNNFATENTETRRPEDGDLVQAYEYAEAVESNLHSVAVDIADWVAEHEYVAVRYTRLWDLLLQYKAACRAAGHEQPTGEDEIEQRRRLVGNHTHQTPDLTTGGDARGTP